MKKRLTLIKISSEDARGFNQIYVPRYGSDLEVSKKLSRGQEVIGSIADGDLRNAKFHRKYWALIRFAFHNLPEKYEELIKSEDDLRQEILMQIGAREKRVSMSGREYFVPKSMKFDKMGATEFEDVYKKTFDFVCQYILPGVSDKDVEEQLLGFM